MEHHSPRGPQTISAELPGHFFSKSGFHLRTTSARFFGLAANRRVRNPCRDLSRPPRGGHSGPACRKCRMRRIAQQRQRSRSMARCWNRPSGQARKHFNPRYRYGHHQGIENRGSVEERLRHVQQHPGRVRRRRSLRARRMVGAVAYLTLHAACSSTGRIRFR